MAPITCAVVRPGELGGSQQARWEAIRSGVPSLASPFLSASFAVHAGSVRRDARVAVLFDEASSGDTAGFLPFHTSPTRFGRPIGHSTSLAQGAVIDPNVEWDASGVVRQCGLRTLTFNLLVEDQPALSRYTVWTEDSPQADLRDGFEDYLEQARRQGRGGPKEAAKRRRQFARKFDLRFTWHERDPEVLRSLLSWKSDQLRRTGKQDWTGRPWIVELLERLHASDRPDCAPVMSTLHAGDDLVAVQFSLRSGAYLAGWMTAYDPAWGAHSPGSVLLLALLRAAAESGVRVFDQAAGTEGYKARWATGHHRMSTAIVPAAGAGVALTAVSRGVWGLARRSPLRHWAGRLHGRLESA